MAKQQDSVGRERTWRVGFLLGLLALGCGPVNELADGSEPVGSSSEALWLSGAKWPGGWITVCWDPTALGLTDFPRLSRDIRQRLLATWSSVANVNFVGWNTCPTSSAGMVRIKLNPDGATKAGGIGYDSAGRTMLINYNTMAAFTVPHEFGHTLGFSHEMARPGFVENPNTACKETDVAGQALGTPPDSLSIMSSSYCHDNVGLTAWDIVGVRNAYGARTGAVAPLVNGYNSTRQDYATVATLAGVSSLETAGYQWTTTEGWVITNQIPGTVPLKLYWSSTRQDLYSTATVEGENSAIAAGYAYVRTEGYVFTSAIAGYTAPLKAYWHPSRQDVVLLTQTLAQNEAVAAGYSFVRIEGHTPVLPPYKVIGDYWHAGRGDHLSTSAGGSLAYAAIDAGYTFQGLIGATWGVPFPGTRPMKNYYQTARADHFAAADPAAIADAQAIGYTWVQDEGYVHWPAVANTIALSSFWHTGNSDAYTTAVPSSAYAQGYFKVRDEGFGPRIEQ